MNVCLSVTYLLAIFGTFFNGALLEIKPNSESTLQLVHVVFRHGDKTTDPTYPNDPHINESYSPYGRGQLTMKGKVKMYGLGKFLRERYNNFLGDTYTPGVLDAVSTQLGRAKMSLELVLAALYSLKVTNPKRLEDLLCQPIPYKQLRFAEDHLMSPATYFCSSYKKHYQAYLNSEKGLKRTQKYADLYSYLTEKTGWRIETVFNISRVYDLFKTEQEWGLKLPEWAKKSHLEQMKQAAIEATSISVATPELTQISGFLLKKIVRDTKRKVDGTAILRNRKLFIYSGHDFNVVQLLSGLGVFYPHVPPYGACVLIELHKINNEYGIKIFYQDYADYPPRALQIPGCESVCPFYRFMKLVENNLPKSDTMCDE